MDTSSPLIDIGHVIQLSVAPVFLLSGIGIILTVLTNRLARVVDRARRLEDAARSSTGEALEERRQELRVIAWRARLMNRAITLSTCSALLVALVVVLLFLGAFLNFNATLPVAGLFILAMLALIATLKTPALQLAQSEAQQMSEDEHPLWVFVNRLAYEAEMTPDQGDPERVRLLKRARATIQQVSNFMRGRFRHLSEAVLTAKPK